MLNFTGISILVFDFGLHTKLWIFGWLMEKAVFSELFYTCALDLAVSVNDPSGL